MSNQFKPGDWSELKRLAEAAVEARPDRQYPTFGYAKAMSQLHEKASPEAILAMIAENERLQAERDQFSAEAQQLDDFSETLGLEIAEAGKREIAYRSERDQLRAEVEALRKDAERYRWLRSVENDVAITFGTHAWEDLSDEYMDAAIDAAMGKGGRADG